MKLIYLLIILFGILVLSGCATAPYQVAGGDRAGGSITMSCNFDLAQSCDSGVTTEMMHQAAEACERWGYESAIPFGGSKRIYDVGQYAGRIEIDFQCMGDLEL